jgi:hypothetical protein
MFDSLINSTDFRLSLPKVIYLEPEHFELSREMSDKVTDEAQHWQTYLNGLALLGLEEWLRERIPDKPVNRDTNGSEAVGYLKVGEFKLCPLATENLLDDVVNIPQNAIEQPLRVAHFYVVLEVDEEQSQVIVRAFVRYDQLVDYLRRANSQLLADGCYQLPLSLFDAEPNHLLFYCRKLESTAIPLPVAATEGSVMPFLAQASEKLPGYIQESRTKLTQWLQGIFDEAWQAIDALISPEANLALSTRNTESGAKRGKLIDLGMRLGSYTVALLVTITQDTQEKLSISIQLQPTGGERYLPPNLKLTLLSKAGKTLQEVASRSQDNYIQLLPFKGEPGKRFSIEVSLLDVSVREDFEL